MGETSMVRRRQSMCVKLDQLKIESDIAISHIKKILDDGRKLLSELEELDQNNFLRRYPQANSVLDSLVNKVIQVNCSLELSSSRDETEEVEGPQVESVLEAINHNNDNEESLPSELFLSQTSHFQNVTVPCDIQVDDILDMCYLHGDNPCDFWLRYYSTKPLEEIIQTLTLCFNGGHLRSCGNPIVGMYVCVCNSEQCFRGKVLQIFKKQPIEILVLNIDKGETKEVLLKDIYYLEEDISSAQMQCINCCLQGNWTDMSLWNETVAEVFSQILKNSILVVTVAGKLPGDPSKFVVEIDCHNEERIISKIELSKWLTTDVFPLLNQVKQNLVPIESLKVLYGCLDSSCTEEEIQSQTHSFLDNNENHHEQLLGSAQCRDNVNINEAAGGCEEESLAKNKTHVKPDLSMPHKPDIATSLEPLTMPAIGSIEMPSKDTKLKSLGSDKDKCSPLTGSDENERNNLQLYDDKCLRLPLDKCNFILSQKVLDLSSGQYFDAMIAHIENPGEFYVHVVCAENTEIDSLGHQMNEFYEKVNNPFKTKSEAKKYIGSFCAAYNINYKAWYRGQIMDWNDENDELICVKFVDYGDKCLIPLKAIQPLVYEFTLFPIFTQCCHLANIYPVNSVPEKLLKSWSLEPINLFKCLIDINTLYTMVVVKDSQNDGSLSVLLYGKSDGICINKSIVDFGYAVHFSSFDDSVDFGLLRRSDRSTESKQIEISLQNDVSNVSEASGIHPVSSVVFRETEVLDHWDPMSEDFYSETNNLYHDDEDATYMVTGYKPQDEKRVCKFFATKGTCYKGQTCLKEHSFLRPDGWTTDKEEVFFEEFGTLILPEEGSDIVLEITEIVNTNTFWAIIRRSNSVKSEESNVGAEESNESEETLLTLNDYLNQKCNIKALKRLEILPSIGQIVLAKFTDGRFYRARILNIKKNSVNVLFVDYGNKEWIPLTNIRNIEKKYLHLPFQAVQCVIANVEKISGDLDGARIFHSLLHGMKTVCAKVIKGYSYVTRMEVLVTNRDGYDIGTKIIESGHGKRRDYSTFSGRIEFVNG